MQMTQLARKLGRTDVKLFGRDRFLMFMLLFIIYIAAALRFGLPWLNTYLAENGVMPGETITQSLADFYPLLVAFFAVFDGSMIAGTIFGFALLDEKEDNTIKAMLVTPVSLGRYILYRIVLAATLTTFIVVAQVLFINQAMLPWWKLVPIAVGGSLTAPIVTLFYAGFAENKVQGMAYAKFVGIAGWLIVPAWFVAEPWQWLFGLFPPYWISKAYWLAFEGSGLWWPALLLGIVTQAGLIALLAKRFTQVVARR